MTIKTWLRQATQQLAQAGVTSPHLDAEVLACIVLATSRAWLLAHDDHILKANTLAQLNHNLLRRKNREPIAYIRGGQAFFGRDFLITPAVLVPRPETETILELLSELPRKAGDTLIDIGTGSGAIAITAKLEHPELEVHATDISLPALDLARQNATRFNTDIRFYQQHLLEHEQHQLFTFIVANLPYVNRSWQRSPETDYEPKNALLADDDGLLLIKQLLQQSNAYLKSGGYLLLEADPRQHKDIIAFGQRLGYRLLNYKDFVILLTKD